MKKIEEHTPAETTRGFIALISIVIMGAIIEAMLAGIAGKVSAYEYALAGRQNKESALYASLSCTSIAQVKFIENSPYSGNESFSIGSSECSVGPVSQIGDTFSMLITATTNDSLETVMLDLDDNSKILSIVEK